MSDLSSNHLIINTDGGSRNNPGPAAAAYIICGNQGQVTHQEGVFLGLATNNEAEYTAVRLALQKVLENFSSQLPVTIEVRTDSQLVAQQLSGVFKVKNERIKAMVAEIKVLESKIGNINFKYIPRTENIAADKLVNETLDQALR